MLRYVALALVGLLASTLAGCGWSASDLPLPGAGLSGPSYQLDVDFEDVLNLPQKAKVSLDGVNVGQVKEIKLDGNTAVVTLAIQQRFRLPKGTTFELRQATALGEVFVAVTEPAKATHGYFAPGDTVPLASTGSAPSIEDTLAALSALLNGGGLENLKTIFTESNKIFDGRIPVTRHLLTGLRTMMATVSTRTGAINQVLESVDSLTSQVLKRQPALDRLLNDVGPAIKELSHQRKQFVAMLASVSRLGTTSRGLLGLIGRHSQSMLARLGPVLDGFAAMKHHMGPALNQMLDFYRALKRATRGSAATSTIRVLGVKTGRY